MLFLILFYKSIKPTISLFPPVDHLWMCHVCSFFLFYVPGQFLVFVMFFSQFLLPCHQLHPHRLCFSPHLPSLTNHLPSVFSLQVFSCSVPDPHRYPCHGSGFLCVSGFYLSSHSFMPSFVLLVFLSRSLGFFWYTGSAAPFV